MTTGHTDTAHALAALGDPRRLAIIELLSDGEHCVCDVSEGLGISNALASHHIKKLREAGLVVTRRKGAWLYCGLDRATFETLGGWALALAAGPRSEGDTCCACSSAQRKEEDR